MVKIFALLITCLLSCTPRVEFKKHEKDVNLIEMDLGPFTLVVPESYSYRELKGVDSFIGTIQNEKVKLQFDFGLYSNPGPISYFDFVNKWLDASLLEDLKADCALSEIEEIDNRDKIHLLSVTKNPEYPNKSTHDLLIEIEFHDIPCKTSLLCTNPEVRINHEKFEILEEQNRSFRSKIYYPKVDSLHVAGIHVVDLGSKRRNRFQYNRLSVSTINYDSQHSVEIIQILKTVKLKAR